MAEYAVLDADGGVVNIIEADQEFIDSLPDLLANPDTDTGSLSADSKFVNVSDLETRPNIGWTRARNGKFVAPVPPEPTPEEVAAQEAAQAEADQRAADNAFLEEVAAKASAGESLTQDEQTRLTIISLRRR